MPIRYCDRKLPTKIRSEIELMSVKLILMDIIEEINSLRIILKSVKRVHHDELIYRENLINCTTESFFDKLDEAKMTQDEHILLSESFANEDIAKEVLVSDFKIKNFESRETSLYYNLGHYIIRMINCRILLMEYKGFLVLTGAKQRVLN